MRKRIENIKYENETGEKRHLRPYSRQQASERKITGIQNRLKSRMHRAAVSLAAALAAAFLWNPTAKSGASARAWWGLLYPKFCLVVDENENAADETKSFVKIKPTFWLAEELAKLLD